MASSVSLLSSVPDGHGILFNRLILLALSIAALAVDASTYSIYNTRIASTGAHTPSNDSLLVVNGVSLIPSTMSIIWSVTHLLFLARRLLHAHRRNRRHLTPADQGGEGGNLRKAVIHPVWLIVADCHCFALFLVMAVLTGIQVTKWKNGQVDYGSEGTRQVNLGACPTFELATGKLDYWCEPAWNQVVNLSNSGTSILGTLAYVLVELMSFPPSCLLSSCIKRFSHIPYTSVDQLTFILFFLSHSGIHLGRVLYACYDLYLLRRHHYVEGTHSKRCTNDGTADCHSYQTEDVK